MNVRWNIHPPSNASNQTCKALFQIDSLKCKATRERALSIQANVPRIDSCRSLRCGDSLTRSHWAEGDLLTRGVGFLTRLTGLLLEIGRPAASLKEIAELPLLSELALRIGDVRGDARMYLKSTCLTRLELVAQVRNFEPYVGVFLWNFRNLFTVSIFISWTCCACSLIRTFKPMPCIGLEA